MKILKDEELAEFRKTDRNAQLKPPVWEWRLSNCAQKAK